MEMVNQKHIANGWTMDGCLVKLSIFVSGCDFGALFQLKRLLLFLLSEADSTVSQQKQGLFFVEKLPWPPGLG